MRWVHGIGFGVMVVVRAPVVHGAAIAFDSAADAAYADGWQPGDNGGSGWGGGWTFLNQSNAVLATTSGSRGWFIGDSRANDSGGITGDSNGDFDINTPSSAAGKAWGVYSNATDQVYAVRPLSGALSVGQTISYDFDNGNVASGQVVGVRFLTNAADIASRVFETRFVGGDSFYTVVSTPNATSTMGFSREGIRVEYTLTGADTYSLKMTRLQDGSTFTTTGVNSAAGSIIAIAAKNQFAGSGAGTDSFFNNFAVGVVPEPSMTTLGALGALTVVARRRNRMG